MPQIRLANLLSASTAEATSAPRLRTRAPQQLVRPGARRPPAGSFYLVWGGVALVIAAASLLIPSTPSYDPWAWLVWGREIVHLKLHTTGGPSWKPLPVLFTTAFAPFGKAAPDMWLVVARAGAVMATVMCFRVAWRLTRGLAGDWGGGAGRVIRLLGPLMAGLIAALSLINSPNVLVENALGYSEGLMTALVLIALELHFDGARRQAFVVGFFASLDRPELWLVWIPYGIYLWRKDLASGRLVAALFVLIPVLWFLPEVWGSGDPLRGVLRAQTPRSNSAAFARCPFCTEFSSHAWPSALPRVEIAALVAIAAAAVSLWRARASRWWRQPGHSPAHAQACVLLLGLAGFGWWVGVALETQAGFSGNDRYLVLGTALIAIAGGVGWAWAAQTVAGMLSRRRKTPTMQGKARPGSTLRSVTGVAAATAAFLAVPPWIGSRGVISIPAIHGALVYQANLRNDLNKAVKQLGGPARILACGTVMTEGFQVPMVAWTLGVHTIQIQAPPASAAHPGPAPNVIFQTRATRNSFLLPVVQAWKNVDYRLVAHVQWFNVYSDCAGKVTL